MANTVKITGQLTLGSQQACDSAFPAGLLQLSFGLVGGCPGTKAAPVSTYHTPNLNSPSAFATLDGVGSGESVTKANTLYFFSKTPVQLRLTTDDGLGGSVVATVPVYGLVLLEFPDTMFLKLLEAKGTGQLEYVASGNQ